MLQEKIEIMGMCLMVVAQTSTTAYDSDTLVREAKDLFRKLTGEDWLWGEGHPISAG